MNNITDLAALRSVSLFGWPFGTQPQVARSRVEIVGVPSDSANSIESGARFGPQSVRRASLLLTPPHIAGIDHGDLELTEDHDWPDLLGPIQKSIESITARRSLPVVLGGDHAISYAAVAGLHTTKRLNIVWFDAHTDFCAWAGGESHNHKQVLRRISGLAHVGRIVQIGHRGLTYQDESRLSDKMLVVTADAAARMHPDTLLEFLRPDEPVYISIDIDAVDPSLAPGTGHPVPGGLSVALLIELAVVVMSKRRVVGVDLMEINPLLDCDNVTSAVGANILRQLLSSLAQARDLSGAGDEGQTNSSRLV